MNKPFIRSIAVAILISCLAELGVPVAALALTGGPSQPEFSKFEPVSTTSMVNEFDGSFTYNLPVLHVPGPDGGEYAMSLSYHSGISPEEEASWVGYGWTLSPGSIARNKRGFPDDHNGAEVTYWNKTKKNWTVSAGWTNQLELFSAEGDQVKSSQIAKLSVGETVRYNNYKGFGHTTDIGVAKGMASMNLSFDDEKGAIFSAKISPPSILQGVKALVKDDENNPSNEKTGVIFSDNLAAEGIKMAGNIASAYAFNALSDNIRPTTMIPYTGSATNYAYNVKLTHDPFPFGYEKGFHGTFTQQKNVPDYRLPSYGYMYSGQAPPHGVMDYSVENSAPYSRRDHYLAIPYGSADNFVVTGEGIAGGFRLFRNTVGHFRPNEINSTFDIDRWIPDLHIGATLGAGLTFGIGQQNTVMRGWSAKQLTSFEKEKLDIPRSNQFFFRYNNDPGGSIAYSSHDGAERADIASDGSSGFNPNINTTNFYSAINNAQKTGRSSYIGYRTIKDMRVNAAPTAEHDIPYRSFTKGKTRVGDVFRTARDYTLDGSTDNDVYENSIGEISTVNDQGYHYTYGLPVYARKEYSISYGVELNNNEKNQNIIYRGLLPPVSPTDVQGAQYKAVVGEYKPEPYATNFLLTEITSSDYVDRTHDGPSRDDFGGYVQFHYKRAATPAGVNVSDKKNGTTGWYRWRVPYTGFFNNQNQISSTDDDMASMSKGEKEVYYLQGVETKTHIAIFITNKTSMTIGGKVIQGSQKERLDAYQAPEEVQANNNPLATEAVTSEGQLQPNTVEYLERIELYAKDLQGKPSTLLKTVHFEYNYSLMKNQPNGAFMPLDDIYPAWYCNGNLDVREIVRAGKLTLKRVWFEYEGVKSAKVAPYVFQYEYKRGDQFPSTLSALYAPIVNHGSTLTRDFDNYYYLVSGSDQNPNYDKYSIDPWGYYQRNGKQRFDERKPWVDQTKIGNQDGFDPAAWHLKSIQLPSGGEILVQYEQQTYSYVQDRSVMAMASISSFEIGENENNYYINIGNLGLSHEQGLTMVQTIRKEFIDKPNSEKMYFKFLYALLGTEALPTNKESEYIDGYVNVKDVGISGNVVRITLGSADDANADIPEKPDDVCKDFIHKNRGGLSREYNPFQDVGTPDDGLSGLAAYGVLHHLAGFRIPDESYCGNMNPAYSFLRVPLPVPKKGGGVRVKRLLMYDKGIESNDASLYGTEYSYETQNDNGETISSGVAANEPASIHEENALVRYLHKRDDQNFFQKIISGADKDQFEGPLGKALLPGAAIGYSRVVSRNIHKGATTPGFAINEYHTWKEYPIREEHTSIAEEPDFYVLPTGIIDVKIDNLWVTQGYSFTMSNMAGQPKSAKTYAGDYDTPNTWLLSTAQEYEYFQPGEKVPMHYGMDKPLQYEYPGKEMEVVFEGRSVEDVTLDGGLQTDVSVPTGSIVPLYLSLMPQLSYSTNKMRTHVTNKIISYPAIVKSMKVFRDGVTHYSEHVAFDPNTGKPLITKTTDGFDALSLKESADHDGTYYSYQIPAAQQYDGMGQKAWNEQAFVQSSSEVGGVKFFKKQDVSGAYYIQASNSDGSGNDDCIYDLHEKFTKGDLVELWQQNTPQGASRGIFHIVDIVGNRINLVPTSYSTTHPDGIEDKVDIEVLASGRTNQLVAGAGSLVSYGRNPNSPDNVPTFLEFPLILHERQEFVDKLNKACKRLTENEPLYISLPSGMQYVAGVSGSWQPVPSGAVLELKREAGQIVLRIGARVMQSYSANHSGTHELVDFLNAALTTYWGAEIASAVVKRATHTTALGFTDYRYNAAQDLAAIQSSMDALVDLYTGNTKKFDWVNGGYSAPFSISMKPSLDIGYQGNYATGIQLGTGAIHLASLQVSHGNTPVIAAHMQSAQTSGNADAAQWNVAPPNVITQTTAAPLPFSFPNGALSSELGEFVQVGDEIEFKSNKIVLGQLPIPGIRLEKLGWVGGQPLCSTVVPLKGTFALDDGGRVVYHKEEGQGICLDVPICPQFWPTLEEKAKNFGNIVAASVQTYKDDWQYNPSLYEPASVTNISFNSFEKAEEGKWRPSSSYVYRTDVPDKDGSTPRAIYNRGVFSEFTLFDWQNEHDNNINNPAKWVRSSTVTAYSPNGQILAEKDVLNMPSAAKFGYHNAVPYLVAKNAEQDAVQFESFENVYARDVVRLVEDGVVVQADGVVATSAHSGKKSYKLEAGRLSYTTAAFAIPRAMANPGTSSGLSVKLWVKHPATMSTPPIEGTVEAAGSSVFSPIPVAFAKVARTGEWTLYEARVDPTSLDAIVGKQAVVSIAKVAGVDMVYIDDVRLQPLDAEMTCYVYDIATLRLLAVLDDQHFGLLYQYNAEGKLVRKIAETERGIKTIVETQYHTPLADYTFKCPPSGGGGDGGGDIPDVSGFRKPVDVDTLGTSSGANGSFDLLDIKLTPDKQSMKMLGRDNINLPDSIRTTTPKVRVPAADSLSKHVLPDVDIKKKMDAIQTPVRTHGDTLNTNKPIQQHKR